MTSCLRKRYLDFIRLYVNRYFQFLILPFSVYSNLVIDITSICPFEIYILLSLIYSCLVLSDGSFFIFKSVFPCSLKIDSACSFIIAQLLSTTCISLFWGMVSHFVLFFLMLLLVDFNFSCSEQSSFPFFCSHPGCTYYFGDFLHVPDCGSCPPHVAEGCQRNFVMP